MAHLKQIIPNRRLSSKSIQNHLQSSIVEDIIAKNLRVIAARLIWKTSKTDLQNAKRLITNKRNFADSIIAQQHGVLYFFSCLTSMQERKRKRQEGSPNSNDEDTEEEPVLPIYPALNYWIVVVPGRDEIERVLFQQLLNSSLDIQELKPIKSRNKTAQKDVLTATLSTCVQDHNNHYVQNLLKESIEYCTKELLSDLLNDTEVEPFRCSADLTGALVREQIIRIVICDEGSRTKIATAVQGLQKLGCELQVCITFKLFQPYSILLGSLNIWYSIIIIVFTHTGDGISKFAW